MQIVVQQIRRSARWVARQPDGMASGEGDTVEEALANYCRLIKVDVGQVEEFNLPGRPSGVRTFRTRAAA